MSGRIVLSATLALGILTTSGAREEPPTLHADVVIHGATPAGIAAALAAADAGRSVILIEPTHRIGGMVTSGLSHTDFRTFEGLTGCYRDFADRVEAHYIKTYGPESHQAKGNFRDSR